MDIPELVEIAKKEDVWRLGNEVLYDLCSKYPNHKTPEEIVAKIWLIGRSYAAAIERRKTESEEKKQENDKFYETDVVNAVLESDLDSNLEKLKGISKINDDTIPEILFVHKFLVDTFKEITRMEKRSLASKYLHFHFPNLFYIYDSRAIASLHKSQNGKKRVILPQGESDKEYAIFFMKLHRWQQEIFKETMNPDNFLTPREMDRLLLNR